MRSNTLNVNVRVRTRCPQFDEDVFSRPILISIHTGNTVG